MRFKVHTYNLAMPSLTINLLPKFITIISLKPKSNKF